VKKQKVGECVYCGRERFLTRDDVPPKNLFPKPRPKNTITVPACEECNGSYKLDDEYFRLVIADANDPRLSPENSNHLLEAKRKLFSARKIGAAKGLLLDRLDRRNGLLTVDWPRVERVVERIVRGLFFHRVGVRLRDTYAVFIWSDWLKQGTEHGADRRTALEEFHRSFLDPPTRIGNEVFEFRFLGDNVDRYGSAWHLLFYGHRSFIAATGANAA